MAVDEWTAEGGVDGAAVTAGSSGGESGTPFVMSVPGSSGVAVTFTSDGLHRFMAMAFTRTSGSTSFYARRDLGAAPRRANRFYVKFDAIPGQDVALVWFRNSGDGQAAGIVLNAAGKFELRNTSNAVVQTATTAIAAGIWYAIQAAIAPGTTTTTGTSEWAYYTGQSTIATQTFPTLTNQNYGTTADIRYNRIGRTADTWVGTYKIDSYGSENLASGQIPLITSPPTSRPVFEVDARASGTTTPVKVSGATLAYTSPSPGYFVFAQSATAVYSFDGNNVTIPPATTAVTVSSRRFNPATGTYV